jgi:hypothetical protein
VKLCHKYKLVLEVQIKKKTVQAVFFHLASGLRVRSREAVVATALLAGMWVT